MSVKSMTMVAAHQTLNVLISLEVFVVFVQQDINWTMIKSLALVSIYHEFASDLRRLQFNVDLYFAQLMLYQSLRYRNQRRLHANFGSKVW